MQSMTEPTPRPAPRPAVRTGIPLPVSRETAATPELRIPVGIGFTYREKATGDLWTLTALRASRAVILTHAVTGEYRDRVAVDTTLPDDYEFTGCDHDNYCCTLHRHHTTPMHRGCILR